MSLLVISGFARTSILSNKNQTLRIRLNPTINAESAYTLAIIVEASSHINAADVENVDVYGIGQSHH